jgi:hypothetical protein
MQKDTSEKEKRDNGLLKALKTIRSSNESDDFQSMKQKQPVSYGYPTRSVSLRIQSMSLVGFYIRTFAKRLLKNQHSCSSDAR